LASIPKEKLQTYVYWLREYAIDWQGEIPYRLHLPGTFGLGSAPPYSPEFIGYLGHINCGNEGCKQCREEDVRLRRYKGGPNDAKYRTTKAFRKLRRVAPREFDAMWMYCMRGLQPSDIARSFNDEAIEKDRPERYSVEAVYLLLFSGVDKVMRWW
jgi:hypothetical protein